LPMTAALLESQRREPAMDGSATRLVNVPIDEIAPTGLEPALTAERGVTVSRPLPLRCSLVIVMGSHSSRLDSYHLNGESDRRSRSEDDRGDDRERHLIH
jgi:hypothetical protein